jgi:predicted alpha/beta hydrolase family esterase
MPRRAARSAPTLLLPGAPEPGDGHWLTWLDEMLHDLGRETRRPPLRDDAAPSLDEWLAVLRGAMADLPPDGFDVVAYSLGAVLWLHHVTSPGRSPRAARVVLVAPPSPRTASADVAQLFPPPLDVEAVRRGADGTVLVGSDADPYLPDGVAAAYGLPLKIATTVVADGGHFDEASGYGPWPAMFDWCCRDNLAFY